MIQSSTSRSSFTRLNIFFGIALLSLFVVATRAGAQTAATSPDGIGFIHGTVKTAGGQTFTGFLRWDDEEAFWGDLFNSRRTETPFLDQRRGGNSKREYEIFGRKISFGWGGSEERRGFVARFGDIQQLEVLGDNKVRLAMKDGAALELEGGSNDVNARVTVHEPGSGSAQVPWKQISTVSFSAAPEYAEPHGSRLVGTVETEEGIFTGPIQWDKQEAVSLDRLDGDEGDIEWSLIMGSIRSIKRVGDDASRVVLRDGRHLELDGSNDVDDDNRGLLVEDLRYGKVEIPWMSFVRLTLVDAKTDPRYSSGPAFSAFAPAGQLRGSVVTTDGRTVTGDVVFDLHQATDWELFVGQQGEVIYHVPFGLIASIEPKGESVKLVLRNGEALTLTGTRSTGEDNAGVLVLRGGTETFVEWSDLKRLQFD